MSDQVKVVNRTGDACGVFWLMGWLFTIGYLKLAFWKGVFGIILWPYYLGVFFHR